MTFTEAQLEQACIELLGQEDIPHVLGGDIVRSEEDVLIKEDLKVFLLNQYKAYKLTESEADQIIRQLEVFSSSDLYESNKAIMKLISDGFALKREDRSQKDIWIYLIDYSDTESTILWGICVATFSKLDMYIIPLPGVSSLPAKYIASKTRSA